MAVSYRSVFILWLSLTTLCFTLGKVKRCEKINIPVCENIGYNLTYMPNMFNHDTQEEAALEVHQFWPLLEMKCSPVLKIFLCSVYAPKCELHVLHAKENEFPPCRSLCESGRNGCAPLMRQYGFSWPEGFRCNQFPKLGQNKTCLHSNVTETTQASTTLSTTLAVSPTGKISNWRKCEKIKISMCENTGYNSTYMPNMFNHHTQAEAALELHKFWLLVKANCSLEMKRFLCHLYVPKCEPHINNVLLPCRRLCRRVRTDCASFMNQHNIDWPHQMNCENFPELGDDKTCLDPEAVGTRHKDGPSSRAVSGLSTATVVGIVIATVAVITVVVVVVAVCHDRKRNPNRYRSVLRSAPASWPRSVVYKSTPPLQCDAAPCCLEAGNSVHQTGIPPPPYSES